VLGVELISRTLTVTAEGLSLRSLFLRREIAFADVAAIEVRARRNDGPLTERATIRARAGQRIVVDSSFPGYRVVLGVLERRTKVPITVRTETGRAAGKASTSG
jgi:hypothetical protein